MGMMGVFIEQWKTPSQKPLYLKQKKGGSYSLKQCLSGGSRSVFLLSTTNISSRNQSSKITKMLNARSTENCKFNLKTVIP